MGNEFNGIIEFRHRFVLRIIVNKSLNNKVDDFSSNHTEIRKAKIKSYLFFRTSGECCFFKVKVDDLFFCPFFFHLFS